MSSHLEIALSRPLPPEADDATPQQLICIDLHFVHVALENEIRRLCVWPMGSAEPDYNMVMGECHHVSHDLPAIQKLHATKAQAGAIRNMILRLQGRGLWDLPKYAVISDHEWIHQ